MKKSENISIDPEISGLQEIIKRRKK